MIRIATIGTSAITYSFVDALAEVSTIELAGVYSRSRETARKAAAAFGAEQTWTDLDAMLASTDVDAVYVASPNGVHHEQALRAIRAGKHVLVEKPAVPTADQFSVLLDEAKDAGVVIFEGMRNAYDPGTAALRALLPKLGQIRRVSLAYSQRSARYDLVLTGRSVNIFDPKLAGGALYDIGVYCVSMLVDLFGVPQAVTASNVTVGSGVDGAGAVLASYPGMVADLSYSKITASDRPSEIQGELATVTFDRVAAPRELVVTYLDGKRDTERLDLSPANMRFEIERFGQLIEGDDPAADQLRTLHTLETIDAIRASSI
ncbi:Gfo/Idh/MocA family oxidoreductase [Brooklawnia sp.]|uniref:Gfo/Idh/MocA family protein n=1 Tax=Brooklawnia sp. TaxID=2699740 RepID=UPI00311DF4FD